MQTEQNKLINFERIVLNDAMEIKKNVVAKIERERKDAIAAIRGELSETAEKRCLREVDAAVRKNNELLVKNSTELRQKLIAGRGELVDRLFARVADRLTEYVKTSEYTKYIQSSIDRAGKQLEGKNIKLLICERDKKPELNLERFSVEYGPEDMLGGFIMIDLDNRLLIDETFSLKLKKQREVFLELSRVKL